MFSTSQLAYLSKCKRVLALTPNGKLDLDGSYKDYRNYIMNKGGEAVPKELSSGDEVP